MEAKLYNQDGDQIGVITLNDAIFGIEPNVPVMHQAYVRQMANARAGTHNTRGRGEVAGSTRKLYRQKGTGRARQGSVRASHRRHGGVAHGPHPRSYEKQMPRKMRRLAVRSALSAKFEQIRFVDALHFDAPRTRAMLELLEDQQLEGKTLIVIDHKQGHENLERSASNLGYVKTLLAHYLNVIDLLTHDNVLMLVDAVRVVDRYLGDGTESQITLVRNGAGAAPAAAPDAATTEAEATSDE